MALGSHALQPAQHDLKWEMALESHDTETFLPSCNNCDAIYANVKLNT